MEVETGRKVGEEVEGAVGGDDVTVTPLVHNGTFCDELLLVGWLGVKH